MRVSHHMVTIPSLRAAATFLSMKGGSRRSEYDIETVSRARQGRRSTTSFATSHLLADGDRSACVGPNKMGMLLLIGSRHLSSHQSAKEHGTFPTPRFGSRL